MENLQKFIAEAKARISRLARETSQWLRGLWGA